MKPKKLYTVILDYAGGTYIAQVQASSPAVALSTWVSKIKGGDLAEWGIRRKSLLRWFKAQKSFQLMVALMFGVYAVLYGET